MPTIVETRETVTASGLMSYGPSFVAMARRARFHADKLLRGANPANLPFEQAGDFELVINLKTAKGLGITIPESILLRADEVIK